MHALAVYSTQLALKSASKIALLWVGKLPGYSTVGTIAQRGRQVEYHFQNRPPRIKVASPDSPAYYSSGALRRTEGSADRRIKPS